jgi:hypothetical protein
MTVAAAAANAPLTYEYSDIFFRNLLNEATHLHDMYIAPVSPFEINISDEQRIRVRHALHRLVTRGEATFTNDMAPSMEHHQQPLLSHAITVPTSHQSTQHHPFTHNATTTTTMITNTGSSGGHPTTTHTISSDNGSGTTTITPSASSEAVGLLRTRSHSRAKSIGATTNERKYLTRQVSIGASLAVTSHPTNINSTTTTSTSHQLASPRHVIGAFSGHTPLNDTQTDSMSPAAGTNNGGSLSTPNSTNVMNQSFSVSATSPIIGGGSRLLLINNNHSPQLLGGVGDALLHTPRTSSAIVLSSRHAPPPMSLLTPSPLALPTTPLQQQHTPRNGVDGAAPPSTPMFTSLSSPRHNGIAGAPPTGLRLSIVSSPRGSVGSIGFVANSTITNSNIGDISITTASMVSSPIHQPLSPVAMSLHTLPPSPPDLKLPSTSLQQERRDVAMELSAIFNEAQSAVLQLLQANCFNRFRFSSYYQDFLNSFKGTILIHDFGSSLSHLHVYVAVMCHRLDSRCSSSCLG